MHIIGLTGGMGMGKTTVATLLQQEGVLVFDADAEVLRLQSEPGPVLLAIANLISDVVHENVLDRSALRQAVLADPILLQKFGAGV